MRLIGYIDNYTYLRIRVSITAPHLLPKYVLGILVLGEISYQLVLQGFNASLLKEVKKKICIPYNFILGHKYLKYLKHARHEANYILEYVFSHG
jgi:hypothetical protein